MATSGQLNTNTVYDSFFFVKWSQGAQDIAKNYTQVYWSCGVCCGHDFYRNAIKMSPVVINGTQVYGGGTYSSFDEGEHTIANGDIWIQHEPNGAKTFSISSFTGWLYSNNNYSSNGGSYTLTPIPREAKITSAPDFTDLDNPTITFSNPGGFRTDVWLEPNPVGDHICVRTSIPNTGSYTWNLSTEERELLRNKCTGKTSCTIRLGLYTHIGDTSYASYADKTFTMAESNATRPTVNMAVSLNNGTLPSKFYGLYIQGKSRLDVSISAGGKYGATISSYSAKIDGKTYNKASFTTDVLTRAGNVDVLCYAKDSRGFTGSASRKIYVTDYSKPLVVPIGSDNAISCYRSDGNGVRVGNSTSVWIKAKRSFYPVSGKNSCALQWRRKPSTNAWDDTIHLWNDLISKTNTADNEYNGLLSGEVFDRKQSYTVQIRAIDDIGEYDLKTFDIPTEDVALHLGEGGKNVSVGSYCDYSEDYTFHSEWKGIFDKDVLVGGDLLIGENKTTLRDYILNIMNGG